MSKSKNTKTAAVKMVKVKILQPIHGYAYFEGDIIELSEDKAAVLVKAKSVEIVK